MAGKIDPRDKKKIQQLSQGISEQRRPKTREEKAIDNALAEAEKRGLTPTPRQRRPDPTELLKGSARTNLNAINPARNFQEYAGIRQQREEEEARMTAARMLTGQYGYKNVAGKAVFVTPNSPLPTPTAQNTATLHEAPGAYGIKPQDYAQAMADIKSFKALEKPEEFTEQSDFVQKWFPDVQNPTLTDFISLGEQLEGDRLEEYQNDFDAYQDYLDRGWRNEFQQNDYAIEYPEAKARYDAAIKLLGEDAEQYLSDNPADYYERYRNTYNPDAANQKDASSGATQFVSENVESPVVRYLPQLVDAAGKYAEVMRFLTTGRIDVEQPDYDAQRYVRMTQQERQTHEMLRSQYGEEAAEGYLQSLEETLNERLTHVENVRAREYAENHPVLSSAETVLTAPMRGMGMAGVLGDTIAGNDVETNDPRLNPTRRAETIRSTVSENMSGLGSFLYNTGMSMGDNLSNMFVYGPVGKFGTLTNMGFGSAGSAYISAVERGASHERAMSAAVASGAAEIIFEEFSLENLINMGDPGSWKNFILNTLKQMGIEGSEELATGLVNEMTDRMIMRDQSNYEIAVRNYMAEGRSEEEARRQANIDAASEIGMGMAGGFLSGGVMGGGQQAVAMMSQRGQNNAPQNTQEQQAQPQQRAQMQQPTQRAETGNRSVNQAQAADPLREAAYERVAQEEAERENAEPDARLYDEYEQRTPAERRNETPVAERPAPVQEARQQQNQTDQQETIEQSESRRRLFWTRQPVAPTETREQRLTRRNPEMMSRVQQRVAQAHAMASTAPYAASSFEANTYYNPYSHAQEQDDTQQEQYETEEQRTETRSNEHTFRTQHGATVRDEYGDEHRVNVVGIESVEDGMPVLHVLDENGEDDYYTSTDLTFDDELGELMGYEGVGRMDARGVRNYLEGYDNKKATPRQYAEAYNSVYQRAAAGLDYETAVNQSYTAQEYLTGHAATSAYSAGMNAYNQTHDTVQAAEVKNETGVRMAGENASLSAQEGRKRGKISKRYSQAAFSKLGKDGRKNAIAQMELLAALASRTGHTIVVEDSIVSGNGAQANAYYDPKTREIHVALDTVGGAYTYAAMHELTHAMKNEHSQTEWNDFVSFVKETLTKNGQSWDELVQYQMDRFGYTRAQAEEEVVCNTAPAMLQDESNILKLYKGNRTLFERVVDWVRGLLKDIKTAGDVLSKRSQSWSQMDALKNDRQALQEMYDRMMTVMEKGSENELEQEEAGDTSEGIKFSAKDDQTNTPEFKRWFGESKIVNKDGTPRIVYHGTNGGDFNVFDWNHTQRADAGWYGRGHYFATSKGEAEMYGSRVIEAYLKIEKPFDFEKEMRMLDGKPTGTIESDNVVTDNVIFAINAAEKLAPIFGSNKYEAYDNAKMEGVEIKWADMRGMVDEVIAEGKIKLLNFGSYYKWEYQSGEGFWGDYTDANEYRTKEEAEREKWNTAASLLFSRRYRINFPLSPEAYYLGGDMRKADAFTKLIKERGYDGVLQGENGDEIVVFDSRQIKSATNNAGTFDPDNLDIRFSMREDSAGNALTEEQQSYFANSKVRDAQGKLMPMYHGTPNGNYDRFRSGTYFTPDREYADVYQYPSASSISVKKNTDAPTTYQVYLNMEKPFDTRNPKERRIFMNEYYRKWGTGSPLTEKGLPDWTDGMDLQEFIEEMGYDYDGLILDEGGVPDGNGGVKSRGMSYVIFDPTQAKTTDNKTPTDDERFKFSMRDTDENVQDALSAQQKAFEQVKGHRITAAEADKLAGTILKKANSDYDQQKLAAELSRIYDYIERGEDVDWNQVDDEMTSLMSRVMEKSKTLNLEHEEMAKPIRDYLRNTSIRLTDKQRAEAANKAGSYGAYRKGLFGRVRLTSAGGTRLDSVWAELSAMNSELFPANASEGDQAMLLMDAVDALKPVYETGMGMNVEESASWLAGQMNEAYFDLPAVKAAAQNARTFGESIVALKNAMKRFEESSWSEYQNALNSIREARGQQQRTQKQEEVEALKKKYKQWRDLDTAMRKEREMKAKYRPKVERTAQTLTNWLNKPTDTKHVPVGVEDSVRRMLASLDFSGKSTKTARELCDQLNGLADALLNAQEGEDENRTIFLERDQQMIDEIRRVAELIRGNTDHQQREGRGVYDLNGMELRELSKWMDVVKHVITEAGKMRGSNLPGDSVEQVAAASMEEIRRKKPQKDKKWITKEWNKHFGVDMQDSFAFFERLGPTSNAVFKGLRQGFDKMAGLVAEAEEHTKTILKGANLRQLTGKHAKKYTIQLKSGRVEMTKAQIMEMYVLSKREQAQGHLYGGGFRLQGDENARPYTISKAELTAITDTLSKDEKRIADGLQRFLSKECASWGNQTSMKLLGYRKFGEEYYWPIRTDSNSRNTTKLEDNYAANISAIKSQGMTKQTIEGAKNAIVIGDIFDTYTRHISNMSAYSAYALPLSDFTRWYNSRGVKTEIEHAMGKDGLKYINNFLMAVNGSSVQQEKSGMSKAAGVLTRNAKVASVGANARVVIQQPTSYARAAMYMSPKYLSEALVMRKPDKELVNKYCPIAQWKRWGFYETNVGPNLRQLIVGDTSAADKVREIAMKPASMGDDWTLNHLWNACEMETREVYPELKRGSEEYYQHVGARMSEIIDRTQVVDSVFHRSQMMRSKNVMDQMLTNFMAEPTKTYNMLMSAISDYADNRRNKAARNRLARAFVVYGVTGLMTAAAAGVIDAFRDDDEEKDWLEKYKAAVLGDYSEAETPLDYAKAAILESNIGSQLNPLGMLPGVNDVLSLLQGYEANRLDQQSIQRIIWAAQEVQKYVNGESKQNLYGVSYKVAQALSSVLGIPASNVMRDLNAFIQTITGYSPTLNPEARKSNTAVRLYEAMAEGKKADAQKLRAELRTKAGMTDKQIDTALAEMLMEDPKVIEAWTAKSEKRYADMNRAHNALTAKGFSSETVDKAIELYGKSITPKEPKTKDPDEQLQVTLYSNEDVASAIRILSGVEQGGSVTEADVHAMISERVAGSSAKDPEKSVKSAIQSELKKDYLAMEKRGDTAGMRKLGTIMTNVLGTTQETMDSWVKDQHADNLRTAVDSYDSAAARRAVSVMRRDGKTDSQIKSSLSGYKEMYITAVRSGDRETANKIKTVLKSLGLTGKNGQALYTDQTFADWLN